MHFRLTIVQRTVRIDLLLYTSISKIPSYPLPLRRNFRHNPILERLIRRNKLIQALQRSAQLALIHIRGRSLRIRSVFGLWWTCGEPDADFLRGVAVFRFGVGDLVVCEAAFLKDAMAVPGGGHGFGCCLRGGGTETAWHRGGCCAKTSCGVGGCCAEAA